MHTLRVEEGKKGKLTAFVETREGRIYLHSRYDPDAEARRFWERKKGNFFLLVGDTLGYLTKHGLKQGFKVVPYVPLQVFNAVSPHWLGEVSPITSEEEALEALRRGADLAVFWQGFFPFASLSPKIWALAQTQKEIHSKRSLEVTYPNVLRNLPHILESLPADMFANAGRGSPCFIVSAGPSLVKNVHLLKLVEGRFPIVAVGTAYRELETAGIMPDLVAISDPQDAVAGTVEGYDGPLLFLPTSCFRAVQNHRGPKIVAFQKDHVLSEALARALSRGTLKVGGSVATLAFSFAKLLGCKPIILVGQDLAYRGIFSHSPGLKRFIFPVQGDSKKPFFEVEGNLFPTVRTSGELLIYKRWFEEEAKSTRVINATEGGAKINGAEFMPLRTAIFKSAGKKEVNLRGIIYSAWDRWEGLPKEAEPVLRDLLERIVRSILR